MKEKAKRVRNLLQEFSIPLILGVLASLAIANLWPASYKQLVEFPLLGGHVSIFGHHVTTQFLINDVFMALFFGIAAKEIKESFLPGGSLHPLNKGFNPIMATVGGVAVPALTCFLLVKWFFAGTADYTVIQKAWGIPTATDIALSWLIAKAIFGIKHPAVTYLLLIAVIDDGIGLFIIAKYYPNPHHPVEPVYLLYTLAGTAIALILSKTKCQHWLLYIMLGGSISWIGLVQSGLHPALALVPIVFLIPGPKKDTGMFNPIDEIDRMGEATASILHRHHSPLHNFEKSFKTTVDFGLFFFAFANAGVAFGKVNEITWIILFSLLFGKMIGISLFSFLALAIGFPLPMGMKKRDVAVVGAVAGTGLTVALFVAGQAFPDNSPFQGPAKMGAVLSFSAGILAFIAAKILGVKRIQEKV